ncbi:MAG: hypothetical protein Q4D58_00885 [Synergistaceae bacterium]|nr:hypothetical protein [Synergistaceae bacterium]
MTLNSLKNIRNIILLLAIIVLIFAQSVFAGTANTPAIRLSAPASAAAGSVITAEIMVEAPANQKLTGIAATLVWDAELLEPVGDPVVREEFFGKPLAARSDAVKGLTEITAASIGDSAVSFADKGGVLFAEQQFRVKEAALKAGKVRIGFTTDKNRSANGTYIVTESGGLNFAIITPVSLLVN